MSALGFAAARAVPYFQQMEATECGVACLAMILAHHGHWSALHELRDECGAGREGTSGERLVRAARARGLDSDGFNVDVEGLAELPLPVILHWEFSHFVVLERMGKQQAVILDPALGRLAVTRDRLRESYTGVALAFEPGPSFMKRPRVRPSLRRYRAVLGIHLPQLTHLVIASLLLHLLGLLVPIGQQLLLDRVILPGQRPWLLGLGVTMVLAVLLRAGLAFSRDWVARNLETMLDLRMVRGFLGHLMDLPLRFFLLRQPGDLIQRTESAVALGNLMGGRAFTAILDLLLVFGHLGLMMAYNARLGLAIAAIALVQVALQAGFRRRNLQALAEELTATGRSSARLLEALDAVENIKAMGAETAACGRWSDQAVQALNARLRRQRLQLAAGTGLGLASTLGTAAVFALAGAQVLRGAMSLGTFSAFLVVEGLFVVLVTELAQTLGQFQVVGSHVARLEDAFQEPTEPGGSLVPATGGGAIAFQQVCFRHRPGEPDILSGLTLTIRPGERIALVGPNGAGKTTLALLIAGLLQPTGGRITCAGRGLTDYHLPAFRRGIGVVLQDAFLLDDTIRTNLSLHGPDLPLARLEEAAKAACIHDFIASLPEGYDTPIGENGTQLSGGQRQRLALARALAHRPWLLLLDEATRSLDPETETQIHRNLARLPCTCVIISHRLEPVRQAERILVLEGGRVVQDGAFEDLAAVTGLFRNLFATGGWAHG